MLSEKQRIEEIKTNHKHKKLLPILPENRYKVVWDVCLIFSLLMFGLMSPVVINFYKNKNMDFYT